MATETVKKEVKKTQPVKSEAKTADGKAAAPKAKKTDVLIAAIRIRGTVGLKTPIEDTLKMVRLYNKHHCVILEATPQNKGMLSKIKDYITYGEITKETLAELEKKRKKQSLSSHAFTIYTLNSPRGGFERKGVKMPFSAGGVLGYRGSKINQLIEKMM